MTQNILELLVSAVRDKRCVAIRYRDQGQIRVIEPHVIYSDETGEVVADSYQTRGYSASGRPTPFWRPFRIRKITALSVLQETFSPRIREGFSPTRLKYRNGLVVMVDDRENNFVYPFEANQQEFVGPSLPKGPFRR